LVPNERGSVVNTGKYAKSIVDAVNSTILTVEQQQAWALVAIAVQLAGLNESFERIADSLEAFIDRGKDVTTRPTST